jgi:hypothetical protein
LGSWMERGTYRCQASRHWEEQICVIRSIRAVIRVRVVPTARDPW